MKLSDIFKKSFWDKRWKDTLDGFSAYGCASTGTWPPPKAPRAEEPPETKPAAEAEQTPKPAAPAPKPPGT